jgi:phenylalanine-4-hydroxylase
MAGREAIQTLCTRLPSLAEVDAWLSKASGWRIVRADGYVDPPVFLAMLAEKHFPCMDQIRHEKEILYSPAPDMFHDIIGHLPMVCRPQFCDYYETFGRAGSRVRHVEQYKMLNRIYWYTMEFGLIADRAGEAPKVFGAALLTGLGELLTAAGDAVRRRPFCLDEVLAAPTNVDRPNDVLYVISSWDELLTAFVDWAKSERLL